MKHFAILLTLAVAFSTTKVTAADNPHAAVHAKVAAPYLDNQSYVVVRINLKRIKLTTLLDHLRKMVPIPGDPRNTADFKKTESAVAALIEEKATEVLFVINLADLGQSQPAVIVPVGKGGNHHTVAALMFSRNPDGPTSRKSAREFGRGAGGSFEICTRLGDAVFCGKETELKRLKKLKPAARPNLVKAFQAAGDSAVQVVFLPGADHRRVIAQMITQLPKELGGGNGADLVDEVRWAAIDVNLPPKLSAELTIQSKDNDSAKSLKKRADIGLKMFAARPEIRKQFKELDKITRLFSPQAKGSQLKLSIDAQGDQFNSIVALFAAPVAAAQSAAYRTQSMNNLKQLGVSMHNFPSTYKGFPPTASYDKNEKKLLSWRVFLLPYLDQNELFQ